MWHHVDASERVLGKLAERIALVLMGKHKPIYDPGVDCGDYVIVTNARNVVVTGNKAKQVRSRLPTLRASADMAQLVYRSHSMYPGALKETPYERMMAKNPDHVIRHAVSGMLPKNRLRDRRLERLYVFPREHMGVLGSNILRSWEDGSLTTYDPHTPITADTLRAFRTQ